MHAPDGVDTTSGVCFVTVVGGGDRTVCIFIETPETDSYSTVSVNDEKKNEIKRTQYILETLNNIR